MRISKVTPKSDYTLEIIATDGRKGIFDVSPYLDLEVFTELKEKTSFAKVRNGGYFIEWGCGADLSSDTIEAHLVLN